MCIAKCADRLEICPTEIFPGGKIFESSIEEEVSCVLPLGKYHYIAHANTGKEIFSPSNFITIGGKDVTFVLDTEIGQVRMPRDWFKYTGLNLSQFEFLELDRFYVRSEDRWLIVHGEVNINIIILDGFLPEKQNYESLSKKNPEVEEGL